MKRLERTTERIWKGHIRVKFIFIVIKTEEERVTYMENNNVTGLEVVSPISHHNYYKDWITIKK